MKKSGEVNSRYKFTFKKKTCGTWKSRFTWQTFSRYCREKRYGYTTSLLSADSSAYRHWIETYHRHCSPTKCQWCRQKVTKKSKTAKDLNKNLLGFCWDIRIIGLMGTQWNSSHQLFSVYSGHLIWSNMYDWNILKPRLTAHVFPTFPLPCLLTRGSNFHSKLKAAEKNNSAEEIVWFRETNSFGKNTFI